MKVYKAIINYGKTLKRKLRHNTICDSVRRPTMTDTILTKRCSNRLGEQGRGSKGEEKQQGWLFEKMKSSTCVKV